MKKRLLCTLLTIIMLVSLIPTAALAAENPFTDVPETINGSPNPFYEAILWAVDNKITTGYEDNTFRPNNTCTRGHVVTFLWRSAGSPEPESLENIFSDVAESSPFYKAILWAAENGITTGYSDGTFRPSAACTRAHVVTFLWRFDNKPAASGALTLTDLAGLNADFTSAIHWAATNGITTGYSDGTFRPNAVCTRAHVVTFIFRDTIHVHNYTDVVTAPTCTEKGYTTHTCECGDSYIDSYTDPVGHKWDKGSVTIPSGTKTPGIKTYICSVCGELKTEDIPTTEHALCLVSEKTTTSETGTTTWTYEHDEYGNIVSGVYTNGSGVQAGTMTSTYHDAPHGILKETVRIVDGDTETTVYDPALNDIKTQKVVSASGFVISTLENTYNENGLLVKAVTVNNALDTVTTEEYTYDSNGHVTKDVLTTDYGEGVKDQIITESTYKNGQLTTETVDGTDVDGSKYTAKIEYKYKNGLESERTTEFSMPDGSSYSLIFTYTYDSAGNMTKQVQKMNLKGLLTPAVTIFTYTYEYVQYDGVYYKTKESVVVPLASLLPSEDDQSYTLEYNYAYK